MADIVSSMTAFHIGAVETADAAKTVDSFMTITPEAAARFIDGEIIYGAVYGFRCVGVDLFGAFRFQLVRLKGDCAL